MRHAPITTSANYEEVQAWNAITRWLHSFRYKHVLDVLAEQRTETLNLVDIGCANAKLFSLLDARQPISYTGIEPYSTFADVARARYGQRPNFKLIESTALPGLAELKPDVVVALETLEHIRQPECVRVIERVAELRPRLFIASVPVETGPAIVAKNLGSYLCGYGRHRPYGFKNTVYAALGMMDRMPPHGTDHIGFDWRWLAQTIRYHFRIREIRRFPLPYLPVSCSATAFMICEPR